MHNKSISGWRICDHARFSKWTTIFPQYLTFGGKNQNSAALRFCIWPFYTFLCDTSTIQWKLLDVFAKLWKKRHFWPRYLTFGGKKSKFRRITFLHMAILHISMWYQHNPMKTVGRVRESMKKRPKTTSFSPAVTLTLTGWPWDICPDIHVFKVNIPCKFCKIEIMGK